MYTYQTTPHNNPKYSDLNFILLISVHWCRYFT